MQRFGPSKVDNKKKKLLVVGGGGREHALAWKFAQSPQVQQIYVAPGNGGTEDEPKVKNIAIAATDIEKLAQFAQAESIDITVVGPEAPLDLGIADLFEQKGLNCLGPKKDAAQIESSKLFAKQFMERHAIPTASYASFDSVQDARAYVDTLTEPVVIKADGLAAGKGVLQAHTHEQAHEAIDTFLVHQQFGDAGKTIVIEEFLRGKELSFFVLTDGHHLMPLSCVLDHKKLKDGNQGPYTGGMGTISPVSWMTPALHNRIIDEIMEPAVAGLRHEGRPFVGFLYAGLMITPQGDPKVLEFNCRLGDPETEPLMMRLETDLFDMCQAVFDQCLGTTSLQWSDQAAVGLVLSSGGYPGSYKKGYKIDGLPRVSSGDVKVFHAGTIKNAEGLVTNGGRVLCVTALGDTIEDARHKAYGSAEIIEWHDRFYRADIGMI